MYCEQLQKDLHPQGKLWDKMRHNTKIIERIERIKYDYDCGQDISYDDLAFLQGQQDFIMQVFCDDIELWQIAGIDEQVWNERHKGANND